MKQKWPILIFSALLTAFIVLAGIWGNAQFERLHSGSVLTGEHAAKGIALDGWRQEAPGQWHFTFTVGEDIPSLTLCVTNTAAPLAHESLTSLERSGELYALDVTPGETVELVFTCSRSPQTWLMTSAFASRAFRFRTMTQLIALTAFVTMGMVLLALYHYKHLPELGYFLLYLVIMSAWALMVFFFPAIRNSLLQRILRSFFSLTVLASALLAAGLLGVKLPRSGRGLLALAAGCVVFFALSTSSYPPLRVGMLVAGMCLCLYYLMAAVNADYEGAALMLLPGAVTTGFRVWALMPGLDSALFVESVPFYLLRCSRLYDLPFAIGCMVFVCRRFALLFDRTEQLARELDALENVADSIHAVSDAMTQLLGTTTLTADKKLDEGRLQFKLAAAEARDAAGKRPSVHETMAAIRAKAAEATEAARRASEDARLNAAEAANAARLAAKGTAEKIAEVTKQLEDGTLHVFDTSAFTVKGETLTSYMADVDTDADNAGDTEAIKDGYFHESEFRAAPYFNVQIDGINLLDEQY